MRSEIAKSISRKNSTTEECPKNPIVTLSLGSCNVKFPVDDAYQKLLNQLRLHRVIQRKQQAAWPTQYAPAPASGD